MKKIISVFLCILILGTIIPYAAATTKIDTERNILNNNSPPDAPTVTAPEEVRRGTFFNIKVVTTDPEGDKVYYKFDINGHNYGWVGPFPSGIEHTEKNFKLIVPPGSYTMGIQAKDIHHAESDWTYVEIYVKSKNRAITWQFIKFLERCPNLFTLLQLLVNL
jgi:hypothetical protein